MINTLSLISLKAAPRVFDLSSGQVHVSIRDQIVRGRILARDLAAGDKKWNRLLVIGAGVAGVSAALEAAAAGKEVLLIDVNDRPFSLQHRTHTRFIGPFMYEWPSTFHADQSYPPGPHPGWPSGSSTPILSWKSSAPLPADQLAAQLEATLQSALTGLSGISLLRLMMDVPAADVTQFMLAWKASRPAVLGTSGVPWGVGLHPRSGIAFTPDYVVLAAGMGRESVEISPGVSGTLFWEDDTLREPETADQKTVILGGGDGALQDALRCVTKFDHPLQFIEALDSNSHCRSELRRAEQALLLIEQQGRLSATWRTDRDAYSEVDRLCRDEAERLAKDSQIAVRLARRCIRRGTGSAEILWRGTQFSKAYMLNRFLVHLVYCAQKQHPDKFLGSMQLRLSPEEIVSSAKLLSSRVRLEISTASGVMRSTVAHNVVVRTGLDKKTVPGSQLLGLQKARASRTRLAHVPLPFVL